MINDFAVGPGYFKHCLRATKDRPFNRIPNIYRQMFVNTGKAKNAFYLVRNIAEAASLAAISIDCQIIPLERLNHEVRNDSAIVLLQAGTISVKYASETCVNT